MRIELRIGCCRFRVAQVGSGRLYFDKPLRLQADAGELILTIDGEIQRWHVTFRPTPEPSTAIEALFESIV